MKLKKLLGAATGLMLGALPIAAETAVAKDYMVTMARPGNVFLIDLESREVVSNCEVPGFFAPGVIVMSPDNTIAYVLNGRWEDVVGVNVDTCEIVFQTKMSHDNVRVKSLASLAVSADGKELYTVQNPTKMLSDRYEVMEPKFAVYNTGDGLDAKPVRTFPAPRRLTVMAANKAGGVYVGGHDIYEVDPNTGKFDVAIANRNWDRPTYSSPDVLAFWPIGTQSDEFMLMYTAAVFTDEKQEELADFVWGASRINLTTGEKSIADFASLEVLMFSGVTNPKKPNELFGVYTQLSKHDLDTKKLIKRIDLPHTYYVINISSDGKEVYVGGTMTDIGIYDAETLERTGEIIVPTGGDMGTATMHVFSR